MTGFSLDSVDQIKKHMKSDFRMDRCRRTAKLIVTMRKEGALPNIGTLRVLIAIAEAEERPHDISSLAVEAALPRTTVFRHLEQMLDDDQVETKRDGRRTTVHLTDRGWIEMARRWELFDPLVDDLVRSQMRYLAEAEVK